MNMMRLPPKTIIFNILSIFICCSFARDIIFPNQSLTNGEVLVSAGGTFALGFFSPNNTANNHIGIWYNNIKIRTIVWVANRQNPIVSNISSLTISSNGSLAITDLNSTLILFAASTTVSNPIAQLLDTGNFIVRDSKSLNSFAWQSFDYPTDTLLPGMKVGWNLRTGVARNITSWKSESDPSIGSYSLALDIRGGHELSQFDGSKRNWRSGMWNGVEFSGIPDVKTYGDFVFTFVNNTDEVYFSYQMANPSTLARVLITYSGFTERYIWVSDSNIWNVVSTTPSGRCDADNSCGPNSICNRSKLPVCECFHGFMPKSATNWALRDASDGCIRKTKLDCANGTDQFMKTSDAILPDTIGAIIDANMSLEECRNNCLRSCSCTGYANADVRGGGSGCVMWVSELSQISGMEDAGQDFYVRLAAVDIAQMPLVKKSNKKRQTIIAITVSLVTGTSLLACLICFICRRKKRLRKDKEENYIEDEDIELPLYDLNTLSAATDDFSIENKLGEGGYGPVYKGKLQGEQEIAVKRLSKNSNQGIDEFKNEVLLIAKLQHRNLVRLLGCCTQGEERMLIYEYMPNKSLDAFLFDKVESINLDWRTRYHIIAGISRGLLYLHQDSRFRIIHRDLKASNVLLDKDMNPKISDFGLARIFGGEEATARTGRVVGTYGYMSPEYAMYGIFSVKSDVFSFGVIVLEIVSGQRNNGISFSEPDSNLLRKAWSLWTEDRGMELIDPSIASDFPVDEIMRCIKVGLLCVQENPEARPTMSSVVLMLNEHQDVSFCELQKPGFTARRDLSYGNSSSANRDVFSTNSISFSMEAGR